MKTFSPKPTDIKRNWVLFDASEKTLGRVSTEIAVYLMGKNKPTYAPHMDGGDHVVVVNSDQLKVTGNKLEDKNYYRHTGFPGGIRSRSLKEMMARDSREVIRLSVKNMLPKNKLQDERMKRLRVFKDENHSHTAQNPKKVEVK